MACAILLSFLVILALFFAWYRLPFRHEACSSYAQFCLIMKKYWFLFILDFIGRPYRFTSCSDCADYGSIALPGWTCGRSFVLTFCFCTFVQNPIYRYWVKQRYSFHTVLKFCFLLFWYYKTIVNLNTQWEFSIKYAVRLRRQIIQKCFKK